MHVGAHESASGGLHKAVERAQEDRCEAIQLFVKNNTRWFQRAWKPKEIQAYRTAYTESDLQGSMAHAAFLINLCTDTKDTLKKSIVALADELDRCALLGLPYLVMHPGSHKGQGEAEGLEQIAKNLEQVYALEGTLGAPDWRGVTLLFENTAGQGTNLGYDLAHLRDLFGLVWDASRFGVCFDTCHAHAAGYDLTTAATYEDFWTTFDQVIGLGRLKTFHLNDSKRELGSRVDRHEQLGQGNIGETCFKLLVNDPRFAGIPAAVETPPLEDGQMSFARNVALLKSWRQPGAPQ